MQANSMDSTPKPQRIKLRSDLVHLRSLPSTRPATKIGQVTWAWAEIEAGLAAGMKLKEVWAAASRDGIEMSYGQFRVCVSRLRRRRHGVPPSVAEQPAQQTNAENGSPVPSHSDPFRNLREQREKKLKSGFEYDPFSINMNFID
jgi:hypothetical protein